MSRRDRKYKANAAKVKREFRALKIMKAVGVIKWLLVVLAVICCIIVRLFYWYNKPGKFIAFGDVTQVVISNIALLALIPIVCLSALMFLIEKLLKGGKGKLIVFATAFLVFLCGGVLGYVAYANRNAIEMMRIKEFMTPDNKHTMYYVESKGERQRVIYRRTGKYVYEKTVSFSTVGRGEDYFPEYKWGKDSFSDGENEYQYSTYTEEN